MRVIASTIVLALAVLMLLPLTMTVTASLKGRAENIGAPLRIIPHNPTLSNYAALTKFQIGRWYLNSAIIAFTGAAINVATGLTVAFGLSKFRFRGRRLVALAILLSIILPGQVVFVQRFMVVRFSGLFDTLWAVILPGAVGGATIWFLMQYMKGIPDDYIDMGRIDGLRQYGLMRWVIAPLCTPAIAALLAMNLVGVWGDYLWPLVMLHSPEHFTLPLGVNEVIARDGAIHTLEANPGLGFAGAVLAMAPGIILFVALQRYFVDGLFKGQK